MWRYPLLWLPMLAIAVANGALRQLLYGPHLSELAAHQLSTLLGVALLGLYMRAVLRRWPLATRGQALAERLVWMSMTLAFETLGMHYLAGVPWPRLLADYDLAAGRVWLAVPLWVDLAPLVFWRRRG